MNLIEFLSQPWPWYVSGPLIGILVPLLLLIDNKKLGVSSSFRTLCAMSLPKNTNLPFLKYDWKSEVWNIYLAIGLVIGGYVGYFLLNSGQDTTLSEAAFKQLSDAGVTDFHSLLPGNFYSWSALSTWKGILRIVGGGFLIGFGTRYANGCTSGHAIFGLGTLQWSSLVAVVGFFIGGLIATHLLFELFF